MRSITHLRKVLTILKVAHRSIIRPHRIIVVIFARTPFEVTRLDHLRDNKTRQTTDGSVHCRRIRNKTKTINDVSFDAMSFRAGRLVQFQDQWEQLEAPAHILKIISGYRIPFYQKPPLGQPHVLGVNIHVPESTKMTNVINKLKEQRVLEPAVFSPSFLSSMFLVPKSDGSVRPIFNLKSLNQYVITDHFKLINVHSIPDFLQPKDWMCKIDLSQAYFHLSVAHSHRRFLRLIYRKELLEMTCLPFGLSTAPKTFATLTNWIAQILRQKGIRIVVYQDDYLVAHQDQATLQKHVHTVVDTLKKLGWLVNHEKSILTPSKTLVYLGIQWNAWSNQKRLPEAKVTTLTAQINQMLRKRCITLKELQSLVGFLNFASFAVPKGRLNYRALLNLLNQNLALDRHVFRVPLAATINLRWWLENCKCPSAIHMPAPSHFLVTDASDIACIVRDH